MRQLALTHLSDVFAIDNDLTPIRLEKSDGKRESNCLSRAAWPKNRECFALFHTKGNAIEYCSLIERFVDIDEFDEIGHVGIVDSVNHESHSLPFVAYPADGTTAGFRPGTGLGCGCRRWCALHVSRSTESGADHRIRGGSGQRPRCAHGTKSAIRSKPMG